MKHSNYNGIVSWALEQVEEFEKELESSRDGRKMEGNRYEKLLGIIASIINTLNEDENKEILGEETLTNLNGDLEKVRRRFERTEGQILLDRARANVDNLLERLFESITELKRRLGNKN